MFESLGGGLIFGKTVLSVNQCGKLRKKTRWQRIFFWLGVEESKSPRKGIEMVEKSKIDETQPFLGRGGIAEAGICVDA